VFGIIMKFLKRTYPMLVLLTSTSLALAQNSTTTLSSLARDVSNLESIRSIKDLTRSFSHFAQLGNFSSVGSLFAPNSTFNYDRSVAAGLDGISLFLEMEAGGMSGEPGSLNTWVIECPLVNPAIDGLSAKARWDGIRFMGDGVGGTRIEGGIFEGEYVKLDEGWKIRVLRWNPLFKGNYTVGWQNVWCAELGIVPYHFEPDEAGVPIPASVDPAPNTTASVGELATRIQRLNDEDAVRNLQNSYGYYVDRRIWPDVLDLFVPSNLSSISVSGLGSVTGREKIAGVLKQSMGPENLTTGVLNEHLQLDTIVSVNGDGKAATSRGIEMALLGDGKGGAGWEFNVFLNQFVKDADGIWKFKDVQITKLMVANYSTGWGNGSLAPLPGVIPEFLDIPRGTVAPGQKMTTASNSSLTDLERALNRSATFDGVENVSSAYGYYAEDLQCTQLREIHAVNAYKEGPFAGFYHGKDRIAAACHTSYGFPDLSNNRTLITFHWSLILLSSIPFRDYE
jgi:hypothetical protein